MSPPQNPLATQQKPALADDTVRFQVELEFVQSLANPNYLNFLAQRDFFKVNKKVILYIFVKIFFSLYYYCLFH